MDDIDYKVTPLSGMHTGDFSLHILDRNQQLFVGNYATESLAKQAGERAVNSHQYRSDGI
jgi:hypothetical protein